METTIDYKGYIIKIDNENDFADNPGDWGNDDYFLVYDHRSFYVKRDYFNPDDIFETMQQGKKLFDGYWFFPVYAYIHSGVSLQLKRWFNCVPQGHNEFDVSFKGFALIKRQKGSWNENIAYSQAEGLLETWNDYLHGNVYGFICKDANDENIDSCWGYYGDPETSGLMDEAKGAIDYEVKKRLQDKISKVKTWIKNHVPIDKRNELILTLNN